MTEREWKEKAIALMVSRGVPFDVAWEMTQDMAEAAKVHSEEDWASVAVEFDGTQQRAH